MTQALGQAEGDPDLRARAIENCRAGRGVDCFSEDGLREWIEAEKSRPPGQRSAIMMQKLESERRAKAAEAEKKKGKPAALK